MLLVGIYEQQVAEVVGVAEKPFKGKDNFNGKTWMSSNRERGD